MLNGKSIFLLLDTLTWVTMPLHANAPAISTAELAESFAGRKRCVNGEKKKKKSVMNPDAWTQANTSLSFWCTGKEKPFFIWLLALKNCKRRLSRHRLLCHANRLNLEALLSSGNFVFLQVLERTWSGNYSFAVHCIFSYYYFFIHVIHQGYSGGIVESKTPLKVMQNITVNYCFQSPEIKIVILNNRHSQ